MHHTRTMTGLLAVPALLMAWGSLRDTMTPLGYWMAWGVWAAVVVTLVWPSPLSRVRSWLMSWATGAFGCLVLGMALAAWVNHDGVTLYQAIKVVMIGVLWLVLSWLVVIHPCLYHFRGLRANN